SEATEVHAGGTAPPFRWKDLWIGTWVGLKHTLVRLALSLLVVVLLLPLNLIPGVGSLLYAGLSGLWGMLGLTAEHLGAPLARHRYPSRTVFRVMRARPALSIGFGPGVWLIPIVPVLNAFFLPLGVVAGTLLFLGLHRADALPARTPASSWSPRAASDGPAGRFQDDPGLNAAVGRFRHLLGNDGAGMPVAAISARLVAP